MRHRSKNLKILENKWSMHAKFWGHRASTKFLGPTNKSCLTFEEDNLVIYQTHLHEWEDKYTLSLISFYNNNL